MRRCKDIFEKQAIWLSESKRERKTEAETERDTERERESY